MKQPKTQPPHSAETRKHRRRHILAITAVVVFALLLAGTIGAWFWWDNSRKQPPEALLKDALNVRTEEEKQIKVESQLGFSLTYDGDFIEGHGQVTTSVKDGNIYGEGYADRELTTPRSYNIVKLTTKNDSEGTGLKFISRPLLTVLTTARQQYFETRQQKYPGLSNTEIAIREFAPENTTLLGREQVTINNVAYEKLLYEFRSGSGTVLTLYLQYVTVQNNRPYVATLDYRPSAKQGDLAPLVQALESLQYAPPAADAQYLTSQSNEKPGLPTVAGASTTLVAASDETLNTPKDLSEGSELSIVAKNQLAVVRVGAINCFDVTLRKSDKSALQEITNACTGGAGSGSIVSKDGLISTNGHVVKIGVRDAIATHLQLLIGGKKSAALQQYVSSFVALGVLSESERKQFLQNLEAGDAKTIEAVPAMLAKLPDSSLGVTREQGEYAVQLDNEPLKLVLDFANTRLQFNYGKTIVKAAYIDSEVDHSVRSLLEAKSTDVALLDIETDRVFPVVKLGAITSLKRGSTLTVVGFPGFVDGGLLTKEKRTIPTATQGDVTSIASNAGGYKLVKASVLAAQGNSGGPAFNEAGEQIGLLTYTILSAGDPDIGKTKFGKDSVIQDIADFVALAAKHGESFDGKSPTSTTWHEGIDAFGRGDFKTAATLFKDVKNDYGDHYLVNSFLAATDAQLGASSQRLAFIIAIAVAAILLLGSILWLVRLLRNHPHPPVAHPYAGPVS